MAGDQGRGRGSGSDTMQIDAAAAFERASGLAERANDNLDSLDSLESGMTQPARDEGATDGAVQRDAMQRSAVQCAPRTGGRSLAAHRHHP